MGNQTNEEDWHELYDEWGDRFLLFARQQTRRLEDAEDILQEAMVQLWTHRDRFPRIDAGLVFTRIRRLAIDRARGEQRRQRREQQYAQVREPASFLPDVDGFGPDLERLLFSLAPEQQEVLVLKIWGAQTFEAIGNTLEISPNTAASRYRYGLEHLRRELSVGNLL